MDNGQEWMLVDTYTGACIGGLDEEDNGIVCESSPDKTGNEFGAHTLYLELISGKGFYGEKTKILDNVA